jgi:inhibitor of KinA sporulation pathway (predicted exonuclease)
MAKRLSAILVIDIEATCWERTPLPAEKSEIAEIGLRVLDATTLEHGERHSIVVRPERSRVSEYCTRLTTLSQSEVERGITFAEACDVLQCECAPRIGCGPAMATTAAASSSANAKCTVSPIHSAHGT